ncbi:hypothetical protein [Caballeronia sp. BR00000012568055]|uniref:hypothetical protein n=1 Tax=Caballeronia sp. BR00000012568055 TaxID=2918761 RepID=UPI0023F77278|nr:hypothetical protein [Caballeronia sp. BR00000012568055]
MMIDTAGMAMLIAVVDGVVWIARSISPWIRCARVILRLSPTAAARELRCVLAMRRAVGAGGIRLIIDGHLSDANQTGSNSVARRVLHKIAGQKRSVPSRDGTLKGNRTVGGAPYRETDGK